MPQDQIRFPYRNELEMPVIGLEAEFKVFVDDVEVVPEDYWRTPEAFIRQPLLKRASKAVQLPTGGALYFDGGVLEVVTPVIEIAPQCTARVVRSLWEQIGFVRDELDAWETRSGKSVRLQAFSCHCNVSFELDRDERSRKRTIQKLAVLLSHLLPVPVIVAGANRRSTGVGVRPRRDRIEITLDFTPDPGLMAATVALIVGVVREVIAWPSYLLSDLEKSGALLLADLVPGRHESRNGWVARDFHFSRNPFQSDIDARDWKTRDGKPTSLRDLARAIAMRFRDSIRKHSDPFSVRLLFSLLRGDTPTLLDLADRPPGYDDVGRSTRWGSVLPELENFAALMNDSEDVASGARRRGDDADDRLAPPWRGEAADRRVSEKSVSVRNRRTRERRMNAAQPSPSKRLARSKYERVFINIASRTPLHIGGETLTPTGVRGWYHAVLRAESGEERVLSIDQLLDHFGGFRT